MVPKPKSADSINEKHLAAYARAYRDVFHAQRQRMVNVYKCSMFVITTNTPFSSKLKVTWQPNHTKLRHVDATIIQYFRKSYFHVSYRRRMSGIMVWQRPSLGDLCKSSEMATLLNSLYFVFNISFLRKYRVKYYDYIAK